MPPAYVAVLVTIGAFGVERYVARLPPNPLAFFGFQQPAAPVASRARPMPDPAYPHVISFYSHVALINRQEGTVVVRLLVLRSGEVGDVNLVRSSGYPQLDAAALIGTGNWRYLPAMRHGEPVSAEVEVAIRFKLSG